MVQLLFFSVGEITGAIPLADISHVIRMVQPVKKPDMLPWEAGTINLHGTAITVISLRTLFGGAPSEPRLTDMLIIARAGKQDIALWVDATSGVQEIPLSPSFSGPGEPVQPEIPGILSLPEGIQVIYDLTRLITKEAPLSREKTRRRKLPPDKKKAADDYPDSSRINAVLSERAKKIAQPEKHLSDTALIEVLRFRLAYREYAIEMKHIREVILTGEITPVPGTPEYISGICVVRGEIISLVDLRVLLSIPEKGLTDLNRVIVLTNQTLTFGILADHITGIGTIELNRIVPPDEDATPPKSNYIKGIAEGSLTVLDTSAMFADPKMIIEDA